MPSCHLANDGFNGSTQAQSDRDEVRVSDPIKMVVSIIGVCDGGDVVPIYVDYPPVIGDGFTIGGRSFKVENRSWDFGEEGQILYVNVREICHDPSN